MRISLKELHKNIMAANTYSLVLVSIIVTLISLTAADPVISQCEEVKNAYVGMGYSALDVPASSIIVKDDLEICPAGFSCCSRDMEIQLVDHSRSVYDSRLLNATDSPKRKLVAATTELHSFFTSQIMKAEKETDEMFTTAYSVQYTQNKQVFSNLFKNFRRYYNGEALDVSDTIHTFFKDVFLKMFSLQNPDYNFTQSYITCVGNKMSDIKPFGTIPDRLQRNLKLALMASRTFIQGLAVGRNVVMQAQKIQPTMTCSKAHMKMNFCPHCRGLPSLKPCANYCLNVMKGCLAYHSELNEPWGSYVDVMNTLAIKLAGDGAFNLESVLNPVKDQISSAIMHYHENSQDILHKIFDSKDGCGQPPSNGSRKKRAADRSPGILPIRKSTVGLRTLVDSVKVTLREMKTLWGHSFAGSICTTLSATSGEACWNGENEAEYHHPIIGNGIMANENNPEVKVEPSVPDPIILAQIHALRNMTQKLYEASMGSENVAWVKLQVPLPNVTTNIGEERSVKSDYEYLMSVSDSRSNNQLQYSIFSGSGMLGSDDEDFANYGSGDGLRIWGNSGKKNNGEGSGSGGLDQEGEDDETDNNGGILPLKTTPEPPNKVQPHIKVTYTESEVTRKYEIRKTTSAPAGSSNCIQYSTHTMLISLLTLLTISCRGQGSL